MVQLNLVAVMCPVGLYDIVDPVVSSVLLVKLELNFLFCRILWFDWTGWTVGSIGLSGSRNESEARDVGFVLAGVWNWDFG